LGTYIGFTPLHYAAAFGSIEAVKTLLESKNIKHIANFQGKKPYEIASTSEKKDLIKNHEDSLNLLLNKHEDIPEYFIPKELENGEEKYDMLEVPALNDGVEPKKVCCFMKRNLCEKFKKISRIVSLFLLILFPWIYFMFTPYSYPWFIIPNGIILLIAALKKIRCKKELLQEKNVYCLSIHSAFYITINLILVISNFYAGGFPWRL
jgi:hypothetical protein